MNPKHLMKCAVLAVSLCLNGSLVASTESYPAVVLKGTQQIPLISEVNGRPYQLIVSLPYSYGREENKRYPVLYVTDGYWDALLLHTMYGNLAYDQSVPEYILVGIGYSDPAFDFDRERMLDLSWEPMTGLDVPSGGGRDFLKVIREEIIPFVDGEFRTDPSWRVLGGSSMGGFFALNAMFADPTSFQAYIAVSPAVNISSRWLFQVEERYRNATDWVRKHTSLPARLFMSVASEEWEDFRGGILAFDQVLRHGGYEGFDYLFRVVDGERHGGTKPEGYSRGIRFAMQPYLDRNPW